MPEKKNYFEFTFTKQIDMFLYLVQFFGRKNLPFTKSNKLLKNYGYLERFTPFLIYRYL